MKKSSHIFFTLLVLILLQSAAIANEADDIKTEDSGGISIDSASEADAAKGDVQETTGEIPDKTEMAADPDSNAAVSHEAVGEKDQAADNNKAEQIPPEENEPAAETNPANASESAGDGSASIAAPVAAEVNDGKVPDAAPAKESRAAGTTSPSAVQEIKKNIPDITPIKESQSIIHSQSTATSPAAADVKHRENSLGQEKNQDKSPAKAPSPYYNLRPVSRDQYRAAPESK